MAGMDYASSRHVESNMEMTAMLMEATSPDSPGGEAVTPNEWREVLDYQREVLTPEAHSLALADRLKQQIDRIGPYDAPNRRLQGELRSFTQAQAQRKGRAHGLHSTSSKRPSGKEPVSLYHTERSTK